MQINENVTYENTFSFGNMLIAQSASYIAQRLHSHSLRTGANKDDYGHQRQSSPAGELANLIIIFPVNISSLHPMFVFILQ